MKKNGLTWKREIAIILAAIMAVSTGPTGSVMAEEYSSTEITSDWEASADTDSAGLTENTDGQIQDGETASGQTDAVTQENEINAQEQVITDDANENDENAESKTGESETADISSSDYQILDVEILETEVTEEVETVTGFENLTWSVSSNVLTISGSGAIPSASDESPLPWADYNTTVTEIVISPGITAIGDMAFYQFTAVESVTIPDTVVSIGHGAFSDCAALESISIPDSVKDLGYSVCWGCSSLRTASIGNGVTQLYLTFNHCSSLESVSIGNNVRDMHDCFNSCSSLTQITIPASVTTISGFIFQGCYKLTSVTFLGNAPSITWKAFDGIPYYGSTYAFYPSGNTTWTEDVMQDYGGNLIWKSDTDYVCYYMDGEGYRYSSLEDLPCETDYIKVSKFTDGTVTQKSGHKSHLCNESHVDQDGNTVDPYTLACGTTYYVVYTCTQCDYMDSTEATAEHVMVAWTYRGTDGTNYINTAAMPCGTEYTEIGICGKCSARVEGTTVYTKEHSYVEAYTVDGTEYNNYNAIPCGSQYTLTEVCEYCCVVNEEKEEETGTVQHSYSDDGYYTVDGVRYSDYDAIPCDTDYILKSTCTKCQSVRRQFVHKTHYSGKFSHYTSADGTVVYKNSNDIPCESSYNMVCVCATCGQEYIEDSGYRTHWFAECSFTDENGEKYAAESDIPCGLNYIISGTCTRCGQVVEESCKQRHRLDYTFTTQDGQEYYSPEYSPELFLFPCGTSYQCTATCERCGLTLITYGTKEHDGTSVYTSEKGIEYDSWEDIPAGLEITKSFTCSICGETFTETCYKGHVPGTKIVQDLNGTIYEDESDVPCGIKYICTYTCSDCGLTYSEYYRSDHETSDFGYVTEEYTGTTYYLDDGTEISGYQNTWPACQFITKVDQCTKCGKYYSELMDTHDWVETDEGEICSICGLSRSEVYGTDNPIFRQTDSASAEDGEVVILAVYSEDYVNYLWQYSLDGGETWEDCADTTNSGIYSFTMNPSYNGMLYRCVVEYGFKTQISDPMLVTMKESIKITSQPEDQSVVAGNKFTFNITAENTNGEPVTYLWQYSRDNGETWTNTTRKKDNYSTTASAALNGRLFRCIVSDAEGNSVISDAATLTVIPAIAITSQTSSLTVNAGEKYSFRVTAVSNRGSSLTYLWQYSKNQKTWTDTTRKLNNYGTTANTAMDGCYYRCMITDADGYVVYSEPAMLRVLSDITITSQPEDQVGTIGVKFTFRVAATGSSLTYLWQYSKDGGKTWINTSRTRNNYGTLASKALNGRMYRCVITDSSNNVKISDPATLTVE